MHQLNNQHLLVVGAQEEVIITLRVEGVEIHMAVVEAAMQEEAARELALNVAKKVT